MGPLVFLIYINDLQNIISLKVLNFTDDTLLYTTFKKHTYIQDSAKFRTFKLVMFCKSLIYIKNNKGPKTEHCGTPTSIFSQFDWYSLKLTNWVLSVEYDFSNKDVFTLIP